MQIEGMAKDGLRETLRKVRNEISFTCSASAHGGPDRKEYVERCREAAQKIMAKLAA